MQATCIVLFDVVFSFKANVCKNIKPTALIGKRSKTQIDRNSNKNAKCAKLPHCLTDTFPQLIEMESFAFSFILSLKPLDPKINICMLFITLDLYAKFM